MPIVINVFFCWFQVAPQPFSWKAVVLYFKKRFLEHFKIRIESKSATSCPVSSDVIRISLLRWQEIQECWMHYWPIRLFQKFLKVYKCTNIKSYLKRKKIINWKEFVHDSKVSCYETKSFVLKSQTLKQNHR